MCASFVHLICVPTVTTIASSTHTPVIREMNQDETVVTIAIITVIVSASGITAITAITIVIIMLKRQKRQGL